MLRADAANALFESNETNNVLAKLLEVRAPETVQTVLRSLNAAEAGFGNLGSLDFSPDGVRLAVAAGNAALIWDLQTGELRRRYYDHNGAIDTVDFSPAGDQVLSGARDGTARIWDADTRKQFRSFPAFPGEADPAVFSGDAARVLAGSGLKLPRLWDMLSGAELTNFLGHANSVTTVALSPDGATALTGSADKTAILWDTATGARLQTFTRHTDAVNAVAFSRDGARVLTASSDGSIILWNVASGAPEVALYQGNAVWGAAFSADGRYVASYNGSSGVAYLWEIASRSLLRTFTPPPEERYPMRGVAVSPDRTVLATTHTDGRIRLWLTGLDAISLHRVSALAVHSDAPVALRSHSVQYFEIAAQPGRNLVIKVEPATNQMTRQAMLAPQSSILNPQSAIDASSDSTVRWQRVGALSEDVQFANLSAPLDTALARQSATGASGFPALPSAIPAVRVVVARGQLPSAYQSELFAQAPLSTLRTEIPVANTTADKYYVLVFSPFLAKGAVNIRVRAEYVDFYLSSVSPNHAGNAGSITVQAHGTGLTPDTTARLIGTNGASIVGQPVFFLDPTRSHLTFDLRGAAPGSYTVQLEKPGAAPAVWSEVFEVGPGTGPRLEAKLSAPSAVRPQRDYTLTLEYANVGDADMAAPLFVVSASQRQPWLYDFVPYVKTLTLAPVNLSSMKKVGEIQLLGINTEGPPGVLPPGARRQIPLYFQAVGNQTEMSFNLEVLRADNTAIDWNVIEAEVRPADLPPDLWTAVWSNFKALAGNTWAEYLHMLDRQANLLAQGGTPTYDLRDLFGAALSQASAGGLRQTLAASVDASASAPGLPLAFSRFALSSLEQRFTIGPLGRGWSHNFEYSLAKADDQTVVVRAPGGGGRRFMLGADAAWKASAGDYGMLLAQAGGAFTLAEKDGLLLSFDANGRLQSVAEPNGNQLALTYTGDQLTGIRHSSGLDLALEYDARGRLSRLTDHAGQVTSYEYDAAGEHLARVVGPGNVTTAYAYEPAAGGVRDHALTSVTFPDGTHQLFSYDARGRLAEQTRDGGAERLRFSYDDSGYVFVTDAYDKVTVLRFGDRGQLLQAADPLGNQALFNYDTQLNLTRLTGPSGEVTELAYDTRGNATRLINPLRQRVDLRYTSLSRLDTLTDARENMTDFTYDPAGNLTGITYPDRSAESFGYDSTGSVTSVRNRRGQTVQFARDALGQITRKLYPGGRTIDYRYDGRGQLTNVTDSAGGEGAPTFLSALRNSNPAADKNVGAPETTSLSYDARGFLTGVAYPDGKGFTFEYNAAGRRIRRVGHDGYALNYGYDSAGRLETLTDGAGHELVRYAYDSAGRLGRETKGNGTITTYSHDLAGQIVALTNYGPASVSAGNPQADKNVGAPGAQGAPTFLSAPVQSFFNYTYDAKGNRRSMTTATGVTSYEYDALNQLTGVTYPGGRHVTYAYDAAGNRTVVNDTGANTIYTANNLNQYTQVGATTFGYDADGNLVHRTDATGITTYEYDAENRLVRVVTPTNGVWQYTYDALGNRTAVAHDGVTSRYLHDPIGLVDVAAEYDAAGSLVARYDHALGLVARSDAAGNAAFYSFDALGNTRELIGDAGSLLNSYDYDAFGAATLVNETVANGFQFVGRFGVDHDQTGMHFMRARYYHPNVGRFGNIDPIRFLGGFNVYQYAKNNPLLLIDPLGLDDFSDMFPTFGSPAADEYFQRELRAYEQGFQATLTSVGDFFGNIELFTPKSFGEGPGFGGGLTLGVSYGVGYGVGIGAAWSMAFRHRSNQVSVPRSSLVLNSVGVTVVSKGYALCAGLHRPHQPTRLAVTWMSLSSAPLTPTTKSHLLVSARTGLSLRPRPSNI